MPGSIQIKVCGITSTEDAFMMLQGGADYIGINVYDGSPRYVNDKHISSILKAIPSGKRVLVSVLPDEALLRSHANDFDFFQIHFPAAEGAPRCPAWADAVGGKDKLWLAPRLDAGEDFPTDLWDAADCFLSDAPSKHAFGGTGRTTDWPKFKELKTTHPDKQLILAGGLNPENIADAITLSGSNFIDLNSGIESAPGKKEATLLKQVINALKNL